MKLSDNVFKLQNSPAFSSSHNWKQLNNKKNSPDTTIADYILRWRWLLMVIWGAAVLAFEFHEHAESHPTFNLQLTDRTFVFEAFFYGVIFPIGGGLVLSVLYYIKLTRDRTEQHLGYQHELNHRLINSPEWKELINTLIKFPRTFIPITGAVLLTNDESDSRFTLAAEWWQQRSRPSGIVARDLRLHACHHCANRSVSTFHPFLSQPHLNNTANGEQIKGYCQPLLHNNQLIAVIRIYLPYSDSPTEDQVDLLTSLAPSMALAIGMARARQIAINKARISEIDRHRIARGLHNSLGQNLTYLQLRLDRLTQNNTLQKNKEVQQELKLLREVADETFQQMRGSVKDLRRLDIIDLSTRLLDQAQSVGKQADFTVELNHQGQSHLLSPLTQNQILRIFQEALTNVARHAQASHIKINLLWTTDSLTITLTDNGRGFNPDAIQSNRQAGLAFMQACATEMNGFLAINSQPNSGTEVAFQLPFVYDAKSAG